MSSRFYTHRAKVAVVVMLLIFMGAARAEERANPRAGKPWLERYTPEADEAPAWDVFSPTIYPGDFTRDLEKYLTDKVRPMVIWTGVITRVEPHAAAQGGGQTFVAAHKYWDWMVTTDDHPILVSNRGEGDFHCSFSGREIERTHAVGEFVIVYGIPLSINPITRVIMLECMKTRVLRPEYFSTDYWSYGRAFVERGDLSDLQVLKQEAP